MPIRDARASWRGTFREGEGTMALGSGAWEGPFGFQSRFEDGAQSNPEELIGAALAGCFSMSVANNLERAGYASETVDTTAEVTLEMKGGQPDITESHLTTEVTVPDIDEEEFRAIVEDAKENCPVSRALGNVDVTLDATLQRP